MKSQFERIYATNEWRHGSGEGSLPVHTSEYRALVENFIREHNIRSVVDFGCGDWQSSALIAWEGANYIGFDIVPCVVEANRKKFARPNIDFRIFNNDFDALPVADLLIVKDVLQHWSNAAIARFLPLFERYQYSLVTNCIGFTKPTITKDIMDGDFRCLDLRMPPFNIQAEELLTFTNRRSILQRLIVRPRWKKSVLLVRPSVPPNRIA